MEREYESLLSKSAVDLTTDMSEISQTKIKNKVKARKNDSSGGQ